MNTTLLFSIVPPGLYVAVQNRTRTAQVLRGVFSSKLSLQHAIQQLESLPKLLVERSAATIASYDHVTQGFVAWDKVAWVATEILLGVEPGLRGQPRWQIGVHLQSHLRDVAAEVAEYVFGRIAPSPFTRTPIADGMQVEFPHSPALSVPLLCGGLRSFEETLRARIAQAT